MRSKTMKRPPKKVAAKKMAAKKAAQKTPPTKSKYTKKVISPAALTPDQIFRALPVKQQHFITEYLANGFNATQAAITAGYAKNSADTQGSRLLVNAKVKEVLAARAQKVMAKREITAEKVLDEIYKLAMFDPRKLFRPDGSLIPITELDDDTAASIAGLDVTELREEGFSIGRLKKIKIADKGINLERLGRYLKLFTDKVEHTGVLGVQLITSVPRPKREPDKEK